MSKDYKDTLNLPQTDFPHEGKSFPKRAIIIGFWEVE